jgi:hypothetical protein
MELLKRDWHRAATRAAAVLVLASAAGCMLIDRMFSGNQPLAFSHKLHVHDQGLACINCHQDVKRKDEPGLPALDECMACHEEIDASKPDDKKIASLFADEQFKARHAAALSAEVVFSHKLHATANQECGTCHVDIEANERITADAGFSMSVCTSCHADQKVATACATCHREIRDSWPPENHHHNWKKAHGGVVRAETGKTMDRCELCHTESKCVACHKDEPPQNHNNFWRLRGHGITAMIDRQNCAACHTPDSCERCHREAIPSNHVGLWSSVKATHCLACHLPLQGEGCAACHKNTNSHLQAHPKPPDHFPGLNCRQCHNGTLAPMPHVDNGSDCNACHM